jgi:alpha-tubulin suppressor-like RCC1 family protein
MKRLTHVICLAVVGLATLAGAPFVSAQTLAGGQFHSVILTSSGTVWTVGENSDGQLGDNTLMIRRVPIVVSGLSNVTAVAAGYNHTLALKSDGTLWTWGDNFYGQLGDGSTTDRKLPVQVTTLSNVVAMAAGQYHSVAVTASGQVYAWGRNTNGQLGTGNTNNASSPVQILSSGGASVGAGQTHTLVVKTDGTVWGTGLNGNGQLGNGNTNQQLSLVQMTGVSGASRAGGGAQFSVVLLADGTAVAAGYNGSGQIGDNTSTQRTTAVAVVGLTGATAIAVGEHHTLARTSSGAVYAWGANGSGRLGDGTTTLRPVPTLVSALPAVQDVATGSAHSLAVTADGTVWAWGSNSSSQLGDGTTANRFVPDTLAGASYTWRVATPSLSPGTGTYNTDRNIVVTTETTAATIRYTRNGNEPTESDPIVASGGTVTVGETQTLKVKAWKIGMLASVTTSATYTMKVAQPSFSPGFGTFTSPTNVTITSSTPGVTIRYTLDGNVPTETSTLYTGPIAIGTTTPLAAIATKTNWSTSDARGPQTYTMNFGTLAPPTIGLAAGTYVGDVSVTLSSPQSGATIRYTTNGTPPTASSTPYNGPVPITKTSTLKAKVFHPNYATSAEASAAYTIKVPTPVLSLAPGSYQPGAQVTVTSPDTAATLRVTFSGIDPTATDGSVSTGTALLLGSFTLKVRATKQDCVDSDVTVATYALTEPLGPGALAAGADHIVLATPQGLLYAWGRNDFGQVGDGSTTTPRTAPKAIPSVTGVIRLAAGDSHTLALTWDGRVFAWGYNNSGRLGDGTTQNQSSPVLVPGLSDVVAIAAGASHSLALTANGSVYAWGVGTSGQLGQGSPTSLPVPTLVPGLSGIVGIAAGEWHSLAVTSTGQVYAWGANGSGQLGDGTITPRNSPVLTSGLTQVSAVRSGSSHNFARVHSGAVYAWGSGSQGQLGIGSGSNVTTPTLVSGFTALDLDAGDLHSLGITNDGAMWAWGDNANSKLGDGTTTDKLSPMALASPTSVAFVAAGDNHSVAITTDGHVWSWGGNSAGQLGDGTTNPQLSPHEVMTIAGTWGATPAPTLSLAPGTYGSPQAVTVSAGAGVTVRYTTTGAVPTEVDPILLPGEIVAIDRTMTLSVKGWIANRAPSAVVVASYQLQPPAPTVSVPAGTYNTAQTVSLQSVPDTEIRYTLDNSVPSETSPLYASALTISQSVTLRARAFRPNWTPSNVFDAAYQIVVPVTPVTTISLAAPATGAVYDAPATVDMQAAVTSNVLITSVHFYEGTTSLGTISTPPYRISWPAPGPGVYTLTASAVDQFGTVTTASSKTITVRTLPVISDVSPSSGLAGTLVTITGTNFGATQGTSSLWLGTKVGIVETWTDGAITTRIAAGASSGTVQVRLPDRKSNSVPLTVLTPVISNATPGSGTAGTSVTISGSNFGASQGTGQVWLGSEAGVVTSWIDTQIVAKIAAGSQTGSVQVLQNGGVSNSVPLTIAGAAPRITWLSPTQGGSGTVVTLSGTGFGAAQGGGTVRLGNSLAEVTGWSDTQVSVTVPTNAVSGLVKLQQGGLWSNAVSFRVPAPPGSASLISPNSVSLVVGETRTLQALDDSGAPITGVTWASSDTDVVSLSTADPPVLTAVAPGTVTINVGNASAEVTVYAGPTLPVGTVVWTNGASTQGGLYPAVPNYDAVADVFAVGPNNEVVAITADGTTAWTTQGLGFGWLFPDFQGGAVLYANEVLTRLDPLTGAPLQLFSYTSPHAQQFGRAEPRIHPDGTVFTTDYACTSSDCTGATDSETRAWVVGVDNRTAATKFRVPLQNATTVQTVAQGDDLLCQGATGTSTLHPSPQSFSAIVAGDGRYYVGYTTRDWTITVQRSAALLYTDATYDLWDQLVAHVVNSDLTAARTKHAQLRAATGESYTSWDSQLDDYLDRGDRTSAISLLNQQNLKYKRLCDLSRSSVLALHVMQVGAGGSSSDVVVKTWDMTDVTTYIRATGPEAPWGYRQVKAYTGPRNVSLEGLNFITDLAEGALASWVAVVQCPGGAPGVLVVVDTCVPATDHHLTSLRNGTLASDVVWQQPGSHAVQLDLQLEDGSFVGTLSDASYTNDTVLAFTATGATKWTLPAYFPLRTGAGGGLVATSGSLDEAVEFDLNGVALRRVTDSSLQRSWTTAAYNGSNGVLELVAAEDISWANSFAPVKDGNLSTFGTSVALFQTQSTTPGTSNVSAGGGCTLGTNQPPLQGPALATYNAARTGLLNWPSASAPGFASDACAVAIKPPYYPDDVKEAIERQVPFDGPATTISQYAAGYFTSRAMNSPAALSALQRNLVAPICALFIPRPSPIPGQVEMAAAAAQAADVGTAEAPSPAKNIYVNTDSRTLQQFTEGTVLHEALHNLTGYTDQGTGRQLPGQDMGLPAYLGAPTQGGKNPITQRLVEAGCAPR